jgi:hypothetical protein
MAISGSNVAERMLASLASCLTPESAERVIQFQLDSETRSRIDDLEHRANKGQLSDPERSEYEECIELIDLIAIFQIQLRRTFPDSVR